MCDDSLHSKAQPLAPGTGEELSLLGDDGQLRPDLLESFRAHIAEQPTIAIMVQGEVCKFTTDGNLHYGSVERIPNLMIIEETRDECILQMGEAIRVLKEEGEVLLSSLEAIPDPEELRSEHPDDA